MCGIIGAINHSGKHRNGMEKVMRDLLWADTLRGMDATGLFVVQKDLTTDWGKEVTDGWTYIAKNDQLRKMLKDAETHPVMIGHNRAATFGDAGDVEFAHPIIVPKKLALVHNGTLTAWPQRHMPGRGIKKIEHDSTAIADLVARQGPQAFVDQCYGSWSIVYYDERNQTTNFLRNEDRPMAMVETEDIIFFGSELGMLMWLVQRNGFKPLKYYHTEPHKLYTFEIGESVPQTSEIRRASSSHGRRFPEAGGYDRAPLGPNFGYGHPNDDTPRRYDQGPWGNRSTPAVERQHSADRGLVTSHDGVWTDAARARYDAERLAREAERRIAATGTEEEETSEAGNQESASRREVVVDINSGKKPHAKKLELYKMFSVGSKMLFSCTHWNPPKDGSYTIHGEAANAVDYGEIQIRGNVKEEDYSVERMQQTDHLFWGDILSIHQIKDSPRVIIWVKNISEAVSLDPNWKKPKSPRQIVDAAGEVIVPNTDEVAEAMVIVPIQQEGSKRKLPGIKTESCQGTPCKGKLWAVGKLRHVTEIWTDSTSRKPVSAKLRLCEDCVEHYADSRDEVVPDVYRGVKVNQAQIVLFGA